MHGHMLGLLPAGLQVRGPQYLFVGKEAVMEGGGGGADSKACVATAGWMQSHTLRLLPAALQIREACRT